MKTARAALALFLLFSLALSLPACRAHETDFFEELRGAFSAELAGEMHGISFSAGMTATACGEDGARTVTLTFYAPESLADTTISLAADGTLGMAAGGVTLDRVFAEGFRPLLELFPTGGDIKKMSLTDAGHTRIEGEGFCLEFLEDGTPVFAENATVSAKIVLFSPQ